MRLLSTHKIQVYEISSDTSSIPAYAILSHTWDGDEISLLDIEGLHGYWESAAGSSDVLVSKKKSFEKIRRATRVARQHGFKYIWVDTCCVDRTNSDDVFEAVNNSYMWFQDAAACYAYLSDVEPADRDDVFAEKSSFRRSRWFTRSWTLSELIAPEKMEFYARDWTHLGSKGAEKFLKLLAKLSGIPIDVLNRQTDLEDVSIATRMQWAAGRHTTRVEDIGYSLLGIFGVQISINYGEGSNAFIRLQQEILPKTHDQSLFAWFADDDPPQAPSQQAGEIKMWGLLADSPRRFAQSGNLQPVTNSTVAEIPWGMTGKGLRAGFIIRPCPEFGFSTDIYEAKLSCEPMDLSTSPPLIFLKRLWGDQFARILADKRSIASSRVTTIQEGTFETIFVKQHPNQAVRHIRITVADQLPAAGVVDRMPISWEVLSAYPEEYWDKKVALKTPGFQTGIVGVMRIKIKLPRDNYLVDVAVGMIHDQRSCRSWCQQFKVPDDEWSPEDTYERIDELLDSGEIAVTNSSSQDCDGTYLPATFSSSERNGYRSLEVSVRISRSWYGSVKPGLRPILKKLTKLQPTVEDGPSHQSEDEQVPGLRNRSMTETELDPISIVCEHDLTRSQTKGDISTYEPRLSKRNLDRGFNHRPSRRDTAPPSVKPRIGMYEENAAVDRARIREHYNQYYAENGDSGAIDSDDDISDGTSSPVGRSNADLQSRATRLFEKLRDLENSCRNLMMLGTRRKVPEVPSARHVPVFMDSMVLSANRSTSTLGRASIDARRQSTSAVGDDASADWHGVCPLHYSCSCRKSLPVSRRGSQSSSTRPPVYAAPRHRKSWIF